ncbi:MAG: hypothetical protein H6672_16820 [Anaerolineaceae bacterium]|nr:hypothetical protein [Anaerolineaceae bacterium]
MALAPQAPEGLVQPAERAAQVRRCSASVAPVGAAHPAHRTPIDPIGVQNRTTSQPQGGTW